MSGLAAGPVPPTRAVRNWLFDEDAIAGLPRPVGADDRELDLEPGATPLQALTAREARAGDQETLPLFRLDVTVVLLLVEPLHLAAH